MNAVLSYLNAPVPRWLALVAVVGTGVAAGAGAYFYLEQKFETEFEERLEEEVSATARFYNHIRKNEFPTVEEAAEKFIGDMDDVEQVLALNVVEDILEPYKSDDMIETLEEGLTLVSKNVFTDVAVGSGDWDEDHELARRVEGEPFVISEDEFDKSELNQAALIWFEGDDVLTDDKDVTIPDVTAVIGDEALSRFGDGSNSPDIVYVQNDKLDCVFEVRRNDGKFVEQVLGFIQHDDSPRLRRFRSSDE